MPEPEPSPDLVAAHAAAPESPLAASAAPVAVAPR